MNCGCGGFFTRRQPTVVPVLPLRKRDDTTAITNPDDRVEPAVEGMENPEEPRDRVTPRRIKDFKDFEKAKSIKSIQLGEKRLAHNTSKSAKTKTTPDAKPSNPPPTVAVQKLQLGRNSPLTPSAPSPTLSAASTHRSHAADAKHSANSPANSPMQPVIPGIVPAGP